MNAAEIIIEARKLAGLTQKQLAERIGKPGSHLCKLETGKHNPSVATLEAIAEALGCELVLKFTKKR